MKPHAVLLLGAIAVFTAASSPQPPLMANTTSEQCTCENCGDLSAHFAAFEERLTAIEKSSASFLQNSTPEVEIVKKEDALQILFNDDIVAEPTVNDEEELVALAPELITEPPAPPVVRMVEPVATENDFIRFVLDNYSGNDWWHNKKQPSANHLVSHGFELKDMQQLTQKELNKLHGAIHTNSMKKLRQAYNGTTRMNYQRGSRVASTGCSTKNRGNRTYFRTKARTRSTGGHWETSCKGNQCFRKWVD